jgi:hypothetical protein
MTRRLVLLPVSAPVTLLLALFLTLSPERPIAQPLLETGTYAGNVRIAAGGDLVLVVWQDRRSGGSDILAARIDRDGQVLNPQGVVVAGTAQVPEERPAVVWDGARFVPNFDRPPGSALVSTIHVRGPRRQVMRH